MTNTCSQTVSQTDGQTVRETDRLTILLSQGHSSPKPLTHIPPISTKFINFPPISIQFINSPYSRSIYVFCFLLFLPRCIYASCSTHTGCPCTRPCLYGHTPPNITN